MQSRQIFFCFCLLLVIPVLVRQTQAKEARDIAKQSFPSVVMQQQTAFIIGYLQIQE